MNTDKQIEEMAKDMCKLPIDCSVCSQHEYVCKAKRYAQRAIDQGYRKSTDVAREIFEEIERNILKLETPYQTLHCIYDGLIAELKKKYMEEEK